MFVLAPLGSRRPPLGLAFLRVGLTFPLAFLFMCDSLFTRGIFSVGVSGGGEGLYGWYWNEFAGDLDWNGDPAVVV